MPPAHTLVQAVQCVLALPQWHHPIGPEILAELRLDRYLDATPSAVEQALAQLGPHRVVATCRRVPEGGGHRGVALHDAQASAHLLRAAHQAQAAYIDCEWATLKAQPDLAQDLTAASSPSRLVVSMHHLTAMPSDAQMQGCVAAAQNLGAYAVKIVGQPQSDDDHRRAAQFATTSVALPLIIIALGEAGLWSRVLQGRWPNPGPYVLACVDAHSAVAPGQPSVADADGLYRIWDVGADTVIYGLLGAPVGHSRSPVLHRTAMDVRGQKGIYVPFLWPGDPQVFLREIAPRLGVRGLSVTAPHKAAALMQSTQATPAARTIGAANTLVWLPPAAPGAPGWLAHNTDAQAAAQSMATAYPHGVAGQRILVLGTGGAARAVAYGLGRMGARVLVWGRRAGAAQALCVQLQGMGEAGPVPTAVAPAALQTLLPTCTGVVHCTPVGMAQQPGSVLDEAALAQLPAHAVVFDTVYAPEETLLLALARARGLHGLNGQDMLARQAEGQYRLFYADAITASV